MSSFSLLFFLRKTCRTQYKSENKRKQQKHNRVKKNIPLVFHLPTLIITYIFTKLYIENIFFLVIQNKGFSLVFLPINSASVTSHENQ